MGGQPKTPIVASIVYAMVGGVLDVELEVDSPYSYP